MASNRLKLNIIGYKTELVWAGSRFSAEARLGSKGPSVQIRLETASPSHLVRILGVTIAPDLWMRILLVFAHRASTCCANFDESDDRWTTAFVHAFVMLACWSGIQTTWPTGYGRSWLLQRDLFRVPVIAGVCHRCCWKICNGTTIQSVSPTSWTFLMHRCLQEKVTRYMVDCCTPVSGVAGRRLLRLRQLTTPYCATAWPAEHVRVPSGLFGRRSDFVELFTGSSPWSIIIEFWQFYETT